MKPKLRTPLLLTTLLLAGCSSRSPLPESDPGSVHFWEKCDVAIVEITDITEGSFVQFKAAHFVVIQPYAGRFDNTHPFPGMTVQWDPSADLPFPTTLERGDRVLLFNDPSRHKGHDWIKLGGFPDFDRSRYLDELETIRAIRRDETPQSLMQNATDSDPIVARYCLDSFRAHASPADIAANKTRLTSIRDSMAGLPTCIIASDILRTLSPEDADANYHWAQTTLLTGANYREDVLNLAYYIARFEGRRAESVSFLTAGLLDPFLRREIRSACFVPLESAPMASFKEPLTDEPMQKIIAAYMKTAQEGDADFRRSARTMLVRFVQQTQDPQQRATLGAQVQEILRAATESERGEMYQYFIQIDQKQLDRALHQQTTAKPTLNPEP